MCRWCRASCGKRQPRGIGKFECEKKSKALGQVDLGSNIRAVGPMATPLSLSVPICKMDVKRSAFQDYSVDKGDNF